MVLRIVFLSLLGYSLAGNIAFRLYERCDETFGKVGDGAIEDARVKWALGWPLQFIKYLIIASLMLLVFGPRALVLGVERGCIFLSRKTHLLFEKIKKMPDQGPPRSREE